MKLARCLLLLLLATACAPTVVPPTKTADVYLQEGETFFDKGLYAEAISSWEKVRETYYSPELNTLAELKIAEAHYLAEDYVLAAAAYDDFLKQHPNHEKRPEVLYNLGMAYYKQMLEPDRDQTMTRNALHTFESLLSLYPDTPRKEEVRVLADRCRNNLAAQELYIGRFYQRKGDHRAAIRRLNRLFADYPNYYDRDQAYFYLGQAYLQAGQRKEAADAFNTLFREFPRSEYILPGQKLLEKHY
jgi:outer membrane protein assembly factor BamD